jgi:thioredoxin 1
MNEPVHVTDAAFDKVVLKSSLPVIVDFWAP